MFRLTINSSFSAAHSLVIRGVAEPVHGHDWQVEAVVRGAQLDSDGLLCDFHELEQSLAEIIAPFQTADLNSASAFAGLNPSAEVVASHIAQKLSISLPSGVDLESLSVTEAPGCKATWSPS